MISDHNGIYLTKKQASICTAVFITLGLLIFIIGYFWGKQSVIEGFAQRASQESFNDKVDCMLAMQSYAEKTGIALPEELTDQVALDKAEKEEQLQEPAVLAGLDQAMQEHLQTEPSKKGSKKSKEVLAATPENHYAILLGFGKKASADQFVRKMKQKYNIEVEVRRKVGKTASGKIARPWYQVTTKSYSCKQDVQNLVDRIVSLEKIKPSDIKII